MGKGYLTPKEAGKILGLRESFIRQQMMGEWAKLGICINRGPGKRNTYRIYPENLEKLKRGEL